MKIAIIGTGNVATHLAKAFKNCAEVVTVNSRSLANLPEHSDLCIISVKDDVISLVAERLKGKTDILAHTSGSVPMNVLNGYAPAIGVIYPMQTFSKDVPLDYSTIPFFIEGNTQLAADSLYNLANSVSQNVHFADGDLRKRLHLAAVFACNFTNRLIADSDIILKAVGLDYKILLPLIRQTIDKLADTPPEKAQTGPAARNDISVIKSHLELIAEDPYLSLIYKTISKRISEAKENECN